MPNIIPIGRVYFEYINAKFLARFQSEIRDTNLDISDDIHGGDYFESIKVQDGYFVPFKQRLENLFGMAKKRHIKRFKSYLQMCVMYRLAVK